MGSGVHPGVDDTRIHSPCGAASVLRAAGRGPGAPLGAAAAAATPLPLATPSRVQDVGFGGVAAPPAEALAGWPAAAGVPSLAVPGHPVDACAPLSWPFCLGDDVVPAALAGSCWTSPFGVSVAAALSTPAALELVPEAAAAAAASGRCSRGSEL
eukprot:6912152-Prymnesium_polylepis.1